MGGKLLAPAIPRLKGRAIRETKKPDNKSDCQFCFKPASLVGGICGGIDLADVSMYTWLIFIGNTRCKFHKTGLSIRCA